MRKKHRFPFALSIEKKGYNEQAIAMLRNDIEAITKLGYEVYSFEVNEALQHVVRILESVVEEYASDNASDATQVAKVQPKPESKEHAPKSQINTDKLDAESLSIADAINTKGLSRINTKRRTIA